jgi:hypothetical protein
MGIHRPSIFLAIPIGIPTMHQGVVSIHIISYEKMYLSLPKEYLKSTCKTTKAIVIQ